MDLLFYYTVKYINIYITIKYLSGMVRQPIERLQNKVFKENLWMFLFKILEEHDEYAYKLRKIVRDEFGF